MRVELRPLLIEFGANINAADKDGATPVFYAAGNGHTEVIKLLIECGVEVNTADTDDYTPLNIAAHIGYTEVVKLLIENGADLNVAINNCYTPLGTASKEGYFKVVKLLIGSGADVNTANMHGYTPLYLAAQEGHTEVVKLLIGSGAKVNTTNTFDESPLYIAANNGHMEVVKLLTDNGANVNIVDRNGYIPLHRAIKEGHIEVVKYLIKSGANLNTSNTYETPLHIAANNGHMEIVKLLLDSGAEINTAGKSGSTPLYSSLYTETNKNTQEIVELLLQYGSNVYRCSTFSDIYEVNQIVTAYYTTNTNLRYAIILQQDILGQSILNRAAFQGDLIQVKNILSKKQLEEIKYQHPLKLALIHGYFDIFKSLTLENKFLIKLLWHAAINLRSNIVEFLLFDTNLKETLSEEEAQKILFRIGKKFEISQANEEILNTISAINRFLYSPIRFDQQRMSELFPFTEDVLEKLLQMAYFRK